MLEVKYMQEVELGHFVDRVCLYSRIDELSYELAFHVLDTNSEIATTLYFVHLSLQDGTFLAPTFNALARAASKSCPHAR